MSDNDRRKKLSPAKRKLLEQRLKKGKKKSSDLSPKAEETLPAPLSSAQRRIWYLQSLQPESYAYNMHQVTLLHGRIDEERLKLAVFQLVESYEILRTSFIEKGTDLLQIVQLKSDNVFRVVDLSVSAPSDIESHRERLAAYGKAEAMKPFLLDSLPLWNLTYVKLSDNSAGLVLIMHHIISDEWSVDVFWQQLAKAYSDVKAELPKPETQYADYSRREQDWLKGSDCEKQTDFWRATLTPEPEKLQLGKKADVASGNNGAQAGITLEQNTIERLKVLALEENASLFMASMAAYSILLHKLYGKNDICIGTPATLRDRPELLNSIGFFLNTLPVRIDVDESLTFREHLRKVRQIMLDAFANKTVPFDLLVKELRPQVSGSENPFFQTMLVIHKDGIGNLSFDDVKAEALHIDSEVAKFDLTLFIKEGESSSVAMAEYNRQTFSSETIEAFLESWAELLENIEQNPDSRIEVLNYLTSTEQDKLHSMGMGAGVEIGNEPLHKLISQNAIDTPEQTAVRYGKESLSYRELVSRANDLAHKLGAIGEQQRVGIYLDRSLEFPIAILGVLKTGAAYVPLDPEYPAERVQYILEDARINTVITTDKLQKELDGTSAHILLIEDIKEVSESPDVSVALDDDVYLIYTSGSTGKPKGVQISHRNLLYSTLARRMFYRDKPTSYLMLSSFSFDSSIAGIFWSLLEGGTLCIPEKDRFMEPDYLTGYIQEYSITHLLAIPSFYQQLLSYDPNRLASLNTVIVAGEALRPTLIEEHYKALPDSVMVNEYGPTEATVWASAANVSKEPRNTIGKAVGATKLYVLNENGTAVLPGMPGELYIGGPQVAKGYFNKPELTRERFIPDPFSKGEILYRTGDRVCWNAEGELSFLGRVDNQVKIRGHRIEPEEIENTLSRLSFVKEAAVLPVSKQNGKQIRESQLQIVQEQEWTSFAERFGSEQLESILLEVEQLTTLEAESMLPEKLRQEDSTTVEYLKSHRENDFAIKLELLQKGFIAPPRDAQRNWMIGQWMAEAAEDLHHLHTLAKRFVSGDTLHGEIYDENANALLSEEIMEDWQTPVMKAMARQVTAAHGDVLEIGFGIGVSATFIQEQGVKSHTIVEMNEYIANTLFADWRKKYADNDINLVLGRWQDALDKLDTYDGVFFHAVPMDEEEFMQEMVGSITFAEHFFPVAASLLRPGGVFTYMTTEVDSLSRRHQRALFKYFSSIAIEVEPLIIPEDTKDWWWADSMVVVKATK